MDEDPEPAEALDQRERADRAGDGEPPLPAEHETGRCGGGQSGGRSELDPTALDADGGEREAGEAAQPACAGEDADADPGRN